VILVACQQSINIPSPCGVTTKSITWEPPDLDGDIGTKFYLSKDNINWDLIFEVEPQNLNSNGMHGEFDTCQPNYYYVMMYDNAGNKSYEGGCFGEGCQKVKIP